MRSSGQLQALLSTTVLFSHLPNTYNRKVWWGRGILIEDPFFGSIKVHLNASATHLTIMQIGCMTLVSLKIYSQWIMQDWRFDHLWCHTVLYTPVSVASHPSRETYYPSLFSAKEWMPPRGWKIFRQTFLSTSDWVQQIMDTTHCEQYLGSPE